MGLGVVPSVNYLKKKKAGSYQMQQLKEEMEEEKEEEKEEEEEEELLVKTGVSTLSYSNQELPSLEKKKVPKRLRISVRVWAIVDV